jgi:hypothetical protein
MYFILGTVVLIVAIIAAFFALPFSKTRTEFTKVTQGLISNAKLQNSVFAEEDIAGLPEPVQKYFRHCGYIGTPKMSSMKIEYPNVAFRMGKDKSALKIKYTQYNFVDEPVRIAYIDSSKYGIPFEGLDAFVGGKGEMKGVLAKLFTLFDQTGETMDRASLVTVLSESLLIPNVALQEYIVWEDIDDLHAKATIFHYGISASGIFTFSVNGEMLAFTTNDRSAVSTDGSNEKVKWSVRLSDYVQSNGIRVPTDFKAIWNYSDGDLVYFDGKGSVEFDPK